MAPTHPNQFTGSVCLVVIATVFRIALIFPLEIYANIGQNHHKLITAHEKLHNGTYSPTIDLGEKITATWGNAAFYWDWIIFIPAIYILPPLNLVVVGVDTLFTVYLSKATYYQTSIIPHSMNACDPKQNGNFTHLLRPAGTNESFFQAAARLNTTVTTPQKMCQSFVSEWQYGVAMSFFYAFISLLGVFSFLNHIKMVKNEEVSLFKHSFEVGGKLILYPLQAVFGLLLGVFWLLPWIIPQMIFRALPLSFKAPVRSGRRHVAKARQGVEQKMMIKMREIKRQMKNKTMMKERYQGGEGQNSPLSEFLGIYDIFMLIIEDLHYLDVMNLSRVSKSVREAVLPAQDFSRRKFVIECYTCRFPSKFRCWACANTTCGECSQLPLIPQTRLLHHFDFCHPYCSSCYQTHVLRHRPINKMEPECRCAAKIRTNNLSKYSRQVCRDCNLRAADELVAMREKRIKVDLKLGLQNSGEKWTKCARTGCDQSLGPGPRWWVCKEATCKKECRNSVHQAWGEASKSEEETAVGGSAV